MLLLVLGKPFQASYTCTSDGAIEGDAILVVSSVGGGVVILLLLNEYCCSLFVLIIQ